VRQSVSLRLMKILCILDVKWKFKCKLGCILKKNAFDVVSSAISKDFYPRFNKIHF